MLCYPLKTMTLIRNNPSQTDRSFWPYVTGVIAFMLCMAITLQVFKWDTLSYDGGFNFQIADNLLSTGRFELDSPPHYRMQTGLPFQFVNAGAVKLFGPNLTNGNSANVFFFILLFLSIGAFAWKFNMPLLPLAFLWGFCSINALHFAFSGYGEVPAVLFFCIGTFFVTHRPGSISSWIYGGVFFGLAVATKLTSALFLLALPALLIQRTRPGLTPFLWCLVATAFTTSSSLYYQAGSPAEIFEVASAILSQTTPSTNLVQLDTPTSLAQYLLRFEKQWSELVLYSFPIPAALKLLLPIGGILVAIRHRNAPSQLSRVLLFLSVGCLVYYTWFLALSSRDWGRRFIQADIVTFLVAGILAHTTFSRPRMSSAITAVVIFISCALVSWRYQWLTSRRMPVSELQAQLKAALEILPPGFKPYGYPGAQASRWRIVLGRPLRELLTQPAFLDCPNFNCERFLFVEDQSSFEPDLFKLVRSYYHLRPVFELGMFKIYRIEGLDLSFWEPFSSSSESSTLRSVHPIHDLNLYANRLIEFREFAVHLGPVHRATGVRMMLSTPPCNLGKSIEGWVSVGSIATTFTVPLLAETVTQDIPHTAGDPSASVLLYLGMDKGEAAWNFDCPPEHSRNPMVQPKEVLRLSMP